MKSRFKYLIYPKFQAVLLLANANIIIFFFLFLVFRARLFFENLQQLLLASGLPLDSPLSQFIVSQSRSMQYEVFLSFVVAIVLTSFFTLWISHRLAGPLVRMIKSLKSASESGTYVTMRFRKGDYFQELPVLFDQVLDKVKSKK